MTASSKLRIGKITATDKIPLPLRLIRMNKNFAAGKKRHRLSARSKAKGRNQKNKERTMHAH